VGSVSSAAINKCNSHIRVIRATISPVPEDLPGDRKVVKVRNSNAKNSRLKGVLFAGQNKNIGGTHDTQSTKLQTTKKARGRPKKRVVG
jgi:hypothetical protein